MERKLESLPRAVLGRRIGKLPHADVPANPRSRLVYDTPKYRGYEVCLDVYGQGGVHAYGILASTQRLEVW